MFCEKHNINLSILENVYLRIYRPVSQLTIILNPSFRDIVMIQNEHNQSLVEECKRNILVEQELTETFKIKHKMKYYIV